MTSVKQPYSQKKEKSEQIETKALSEIVWKTNEEQGSEKCKADVFFPTVFNGRKTLLMPLQRPFMASFNPLACLRKETPCGAK